VIARLKKTRELPLGFCLFVAHKRYLSALYGKEFAPDGYSYDSLSKNRAGNFHRHLRRICGFPL
jgi:hypothetical protein